MSSWPLPLPLPNSPHPERPQQQQQQQQQQHPPQQQPPPGSDADRPHRRRPLPSMQHILNCSFSSWYPLFKAITLKSVVIPLPEPFVDYLNADGVFLPLDSNGNSQPARYRSSARSDSESVSEDDGYEDEDEDGDGDDDENKWARTPHFPDLDREIASAIESLGGSVFPKLNWSSPKDASWMGLGGSLKCTSPSDVFLLLKSSDFVAHDLSHAFEACGGTRAGTEGEDGESQEEDEEEDEGGEDGQEEEMHGGEWDDADVDRRRRRRRRRGGQPPHNDGDGRVRAGGIDGIPERPESFDLVLRKWYDLHPAMEYRCFVRDDQLIGVCQRDYRNYYEFLVDLRPTFEEKIKTFFESKIKGKFPDPSFVFDVYINKGNQRVWLVDFNPFCATTDGLLFSWLELETATAFEFRLVRPEDASASLQPMYATNRFPKDAIDLSNGRSIDEFAAQFSSELLRTLD